MNPLSNCLKLGLFLVLSFFPPRVLAANFEQPAFLISALGHFHSIGPPFLNPLSAEVAVGHVLHSYVYFGADADLWFASRPIAGETETLNYLSLGPEFGFFKGSPRVFILISGSALFLLRLQVASTSGNTYGPLLFTPAFRARLTVGARLHPRLALTLSGGYRFDSKGQLRDPADDSSWGELSLTSVFLTAGLTFTL